LFLSNTSCWSQIPSDLFGNHPGCVNMICTKVHVEIGIKGHSASCPWPGWFALLPGESEIAMVARRQIIMGKWSVRRLFSSNRLKRFYFDLMWELFPSAVHCIEAIHFCLRSIPKKYCCLFMVPNPASNAGALIPRWVSLAACCVVLSLLHGIDQQLWIPHKFIIRSWLLAALFLRPLTCKNIFVMANRTIKKLEALCNLWRSALRQNHISRDKKYADSIGPNHGSHRMTALHSMCQSFGMVPLVAPARNYHLRR